MKKKLILFFKSIINFIKYNRQFSVYVLLSLLCSIYLRLYTTGEILTLKPIFFELAMSLIIGAFGFFRKPQKQFSYYFTCLIILSIVCIINSIYYDFYNSFASFSLLTALKQVKEVDNAVVTKLNILQFLYLLAPICLLVFNKILKNRDYFNFVAKFEKSKTNIRKTLLSGGVILAMALITCSATAFSRLAKQWNREYIVNRFGIIIYQANDFINTLKPSIDSWFGYDVAYKNYTDYYNEKSKEHPNNEYTNIFKGKNIIFVHMESMTSLLMDTKINDVEIAPNLKQIANEGIYFKNFYPQIGVGTSSDTEFTLSSSLMPATNGTVFVSYYDRTFDTIQKNFKDLGYYTFSMHANKASMWNRSIMHPSLGYTDFYSSTSFNIDETVGLGLSDKSFFKQAMPILENIENNNQNYLGTIITLSNHTPFELSSDNNLDFSYTKIDPETGKETKYNYLENTILGNYFKSSHYADEALGEFISYVKESNAFNNTIFVFYGDHDPKLSIDEFNNYYNFNFENGEVYTKEDENYINYDYYENELNKKTPLIIWSKNEQFHKEIQYYMGMIDVLPTIENMFGITNKHALGNDIFNIKDNNIITYPNGNFLTNKLYYNSSKEEYKALNTDEPISEDYINTCKEYVDKIIEISNNIIVYNLIESESK